MAWQLHYTSARSGPSGRAGFQFVASTPGLPPGAEATVGPYLTYRPPPGAPAAPGPAELGGLPVAFSYDLADGRAVLVRCRYLGRDYSGRYGNFLAHAVIADPGELVGVRPIELWRAGFWCDAPARGELPPLDDLAPGEAFDPDALAHWLAAVHGHELFAGMMDAVITVVAQGHGRVTIVADDVDTIARWIAVVSYSLPAASAASLSFVTYTDDPGGAPYRLVGTTPEVWEATPGTAPAFFIDLPPRLRRRLSGADAACANPDLPGAETAEKARHRPGVGRYARAAAERWREHDLAGLDALSELAALGSGHQGFDSAAALLALCRGKPAVTAAEEAAAAALLRRHGADVPAWVWRDLAPALPKIGFELAAALCELTAGDPAAGELAERCAVRCILLALADPGLRPRLPAGASDPAPDPASDPARGRRGARSRAELAPAFGDAVAAAPTLIEIAAIAALAERCHVPLRGTDVAAAAAATAGPGGGDLLAAVHAAPPRLRDDLIAGALTGLEAATPGSRAALLTDAVCDLVAGHDLSATPRVALRVLGSVGRRRRVSRVETTREVIALHRPGLPAEEIDAALHSLWSGAAPTVAECAALLDSWGPDSVTTALSSYPTLAGLPSRAFAAGGDLGTPELVRLAERVGAMPWPDGGPPALRADADVVMGYATVMRAGLHSLDVPDLVRSLNHVAAAPATPALLDAAFAGAARRFAGRPPEFTESLLAALGEPARARLADRLRHEAGRRGPDRRRLFRRRGG
ncbi:MAG TPA: hypothetical protein VF069_05370 [Streptosporangiaceae bacterium]